MLNISRCIVRRVHVALIRHPIIKVLIPRDGTRMDRCLDGRERISSEKDLSR